MTKSITHLFENHLQYGDLQLPYSNIKDEMKPTMEELNKSIRKESEEEDYPIAG